MRYRVHRMRPDLTVDPEPAITFDAVGWAFSGAFRDGIDLQFIDLDGDTLHTTVLSGPTNGSLTLNDDGSFTYTPNTNFFGVDGFTYQLSDGTATSALPGVVAITVNLINVAPVALPDVYPQIGTFDEEGTLVIDAAHGVTYPTALPAGYDPAANAGSITSGVWQFWYSTDDAISANVSTLATAISADLHSLGAMGHTDAAIGAVDIAAAIAFVEARLA